MNKLFTLTGFVILSSFVACNNKSEVLATDSPARQIVIFDTDSNNELDDQHALAYLLLNGNTFIVKGITINATYNGGDIDKHYEEAERVLKLCDLDGEIPILPGANASFPEIKPHISEQEFDGYEAVNFIIESAQKSEEKLIIIAVGKLTNLALAIEKAPSITQKLRIVWLGSNYPDPGEYNQVNDTSAINYVLRTDVPFEMVTVRYGKPSGTDAIRVTQKEANEYMPGKGPQISGSVTGRHGGSFSNFGDYSQNLFKHIDYHGDPPSRALFDMAAVAIVKNPDWANYSLIPAPVLINNNWVDQPDNTRKMGLWEDFQKDEILRDFYTTFDNYVLVQKE